MKDNTSKVTSKRCQAYSLCDCFFRFKDHPLSQAREQVIDSVRGEELGRLHYKEFGYPSQSAIIYGYFVVSDPVYIRIIFLTVLLFIRGRNRVLSTTSTLFPRRYVLVTTVNIC